MNRPESTAKHPLAVRFQTLSLQVIAETAVPASDMQVYEQEPTNGLFYRHSGRLLTSQDKGGYVERARAGHEIGALFELQRSGSVTRQTPRTVTERRINPVFDLDNPETRPYVAIRWVDEEGVHEAHPQRYDGNPTSVSILSWLGDRVHDDDFLTTTSSSYDRKIRSARIKDPALEFYDRALQAYQDIKHASL